MSCYQALAMVFRAARRPERCRRQLLLIWSCNAWSCSMNGCTPILQSTLLQIKKHACAGDAAGCVTLTNSEAVDQEEDGCEGNEQNRLPHFRPNAAVQRIASDKATSD